MTTPARRPSPAVYRRRRLAVLAGLVLIIAVIVLIVVLIVAQPWRGSGDQPVAATTPATSPAATTASSASSASAPPATAATPADAAATGTAAPPRSCTAADLRVEALTDAAEYAAGQNPQLSLRLTNTSATDCTMNVGTASQTFTVRSGDDVWWRSTDCQTDSADQVVTLAAGQSVTSAAPIAWDRTRSSVDTCGSSRAAAPGGGATYRLSTTIGGVPSGADAVFILD